MTKDRIREEVWGALEESGTARFPYPPHGRIPNFAGAEVAADRLAVTGAWSAATTVKANPDAPQRFVRRRALGAGKTVYMAVPRLGNEACFLRLAPEEIDDLDEASTISGASDYGEPLRPGDMPEIELIVSGSVAVTPSGDRIGKGEGYSDLEFAILREAGLVGDETWTATTVHELQIRDEPVETTTVDVPMDLIVSPDRTIEVTPQRAKPSGIEWGRIDAEMIADMPILQRLRPEE